jgi:hypothetical protein
MIPTEFFSQTRWLCFQNLDAWIVPPHAVMMITGIDQSKDNRPLLCRRPAWDGIKTPGHPPPTWLPHQIIAINGPSPVQPGDYGICTQDTPCYALYETRDGTPLTGDNWGPSAGGRQHCEIKPDAPEWKLRAGNTGFSIVGDPQIFEMPDLADPIDGSTTYGRVLVMGPPMLQVSDTWCAAQAILLTKMDLCTKDILVNNCSGCWPGQGECKIQFPDSPTKEKCVVYFLPCGAPWHLTRAVDDTQACDHHPGELVKGLFPDQEFSVQEIIVVTDAVVDLPPGTPDKLRVEPGEYMGQAIIRQHIASGCACSGEIGRAHV